MQKVFILALVILEAATSRPVKSANYVSETHERVIEEKSAVQKPANLARAIITAPAPKPTDLVGLNSKRAEQVIKAMEEVFWKFNFGGAGQRHSGPIPSEFRDLSGGQCESSVEALRRLLVGIIEVSQLDLVVPLGGSLAGHSVAYLSTPKGHIIADTTFGVLFVHRGNRNPKAAFQKGEYKVYVVGRSPLRYARKIGTPLSYYTTAGLPRASFALPGEPIVAETAPIRIGQGHRIGSADKSHIDIQRYLGSYHSGIGNYYRPTTLIYWFSGMKGSRYLFQFSMEKPHTNPLNIHIDVLSDKKEIITSTATTLPNDRDLLSIAVQAPSRKFGLKFTKKEMGSRFIDVIDVYPLHGNLSTHVGG